jgi:signal peptidase I
MTDEAAVAGEATPPKPRKKRGMLLLLRDVLFILLAALVISFVIKTFFIRSFYIPSGSMMNTLQVNDRVIVSLLTPGAVPLKRGDVVVFSDPGGWLTGEDTGPVAPSNPINSALAFIGLIPPNDNSHLIKRVIGLPGDKIRCCTVAGKLSINGVAIDEPYILLNPGETNDAPTQFSITVPKGEIWVMGDNRDDSKDSAYHEANQDATPFVPISDVTGTAFVISWPANRWSWLGNYPAVFADVPKS